jgi:transposase-like protein
MENLLTEEVTDRIGAGRYERSCERRGYRNGHYVRDLLTRFGLVEDIRVPRLDQGGMEFTVLNRYEHRRRDVDAAIGRLFLNGVSTRKLKGLARELFGKEVSAQTVSNTLASLAQVLQ